jgi:hypothetical protein
VSQFRTALAPWIFIAVGAVSPAIGAALLISIPAGIVLSVRSLRFLKSVRSKDEDRDMPVDP